MKEAQLAAEIQRLHDQEQEQLQCIEEAQAEVLRLADEGEHRIGKLEEIRKAARDAHLGQPALEQDSCFVLDLEQDDHRSPEKKNRRTKDPIIPEGVSVPASSPAQPSELSMVPAELVERLKSDYSSDRASDKSDRRSLSLSFG